MKLKIIFVGAITLLLITKSQAQETPQNPIDTLTTSVQKIQEQLDIMKKLKISGYIQSQFQMAGSSGIESFAGGNFSENVDKRFAVRRGRFKIAYDNNLSLYTIQIDVTEKGVVIKDAYSRITDPWSKAFSLTAGVFDRPYGFEISYSSSMRESPERSRVTQTIFPDEKEVGAKITFQLPKTSQWNFLKIEGGMFNGSGPKAVDFDYQKDFIGNIGINKTIKNDKINYGFRISYYDGGWRQGTSGVYIMSNDSLGLSSYLLNKDTANYGAITKRKYMGSDFQMTINWALGATTLRGEFTQGQQPGTSTTSVSPSKQPTTDTYKRNFNGAYFYIIQDIMKTKHQLVLKYDWYDPNIEISGDDIGKPATASLGKSFSQTNKQDIAYTTLGIGWTYHWDKNVKIVAYYDMVTNETSKNLSGYSKDLKDNVFTLRVQYKF